MPSKKNFRNNNPALAYLSAINSDDKEHPKKSEQSQKQSPYRNTREAKSKRVQLLIRPSVYERIKQTAINHQISVNEAINLAIEYYIDTEKE